MFGISRLMVVPAVLLVFTVLLAQGTTSQATAMCNFDANHQVVIEYQRFGVNSKTPVFGREIPYDKVWAPGGKPMTLFANVPLTIGGHDIPVGAYPLFVIPSQKQWKLVVSKNTDTSGRYDEQDDLVRIRWITGNWTSRKASSGFSLPMSPPEQCSMRLDVERARAWVIFK